MLPINICVSAHPKPSNEKAVQWLVQYLIDTKDKDYIIDFKLDKGLRVHADASFSKN